MRETAPLAKAGGPLLMVAPTQRPWARDLDSADGLAEVAELVERFGSFMQRFPQAERRKMFGYPAAFVGGHMVTGLHGRRWLVRLPDEDLDELLGLDGAARFEPMPGRPMKGFGVLPPQVAGDDEALAGWVERALAYAASLPPRERKR